MPPRHRWRLSSPVDLFSRGPLSDTTQDFAQLGAQWTDPQNILSILTVIGGEIVQSAIAQLCSCTPSYFTPVALSFGWVAYSFSAILAAIGSHRLTPAPDFECTLIEAGSMYSRTVNSWVLSRLVRDYEFPGDTPGGLTVTFYRTLPDKTMGVADHDWVYWTGVTVIVLQLAIAVIPGALAGDWAIFILTFGGILLTQRQASLPQWRKELWSGRLIEHGKQEVVCLTRGNGSPYAMVIRSDSCGIRMADMASGLEVKDRTTIPATLALAVLWLIHLFCTSALETHTWYSLFIGAIGMLQNALASGARRHPSALGIHLEKVNEVQSDKVFQALVKAEEVEKNVGLLLTDIYFPGGLRPEEDAWKRAKLEQHARARSAGSVHRNSMTEPPSGHSSTTGTFATTSEDSESSAPDPSRDAVSPTSAFKAPDYKVSDAYDAPCTPQAPALGHNHRAVQVTGLEATESEADIDYPKIVASVPLDSEAINPPLNVELLATPCHFRLADVSTFLESNSLRILEYPPPSSEQDRLEELCDSRTILPPYAALSYPWRDLQLPDGHSCPSLSVSGALHADPISLNVLRTACVAAKEYGCTHLWLDRLCIMQTHKRDKTWQIQRMYQIYKRCGVCLVLPGGLVRLPRLDDSTSWIDRAWTLQEALAPHDIKRVKVIIHITHPSFRDFIAYRSMHLQIKQYAPNLVHRPLRFPIRILRPSETKRLISAHDFGGFRLWTASYTRSSSRPIDMVLSLMQLFNTRIAVSRFGEGDRLRATIALIQTLMSRRGPQLGLATFLYIAPTMEPSRELSTLPQMPETSESGQAYINTRKGRVLAYRAFGGGGTNEWEARGVPKGEMTDSGYLVLWSKAAPMVGHMDVGDAGCSARSKVYDDREIWAVVIGEKRNYNRNPVTWHIEAYNPAEGGPAAPGGLVELTLMLIEKHGYELYHRTGMEREIDARKTSGWNWTFRSFRVGGPGRGGRQRFAVSPSGPVFQPDLGDEEENDESMRWADRNHPDPEPMTKYDED
ncbi:hypothetical protein B0H11DRAFT_2270539 [Mycena galericulata]|nr:hypothetical protein B0H11DRAFT_2270539 [Mycena galericulata]